MNAQQQDWDLPSHLPGEGPECETTLHADDTIPLSKGSVSLDKKPIAIPGTDITLVTEEDIAKWIEERRKKWPTTSNIRIKNEEAKKRRLENPTSENSTTKKQRQVCRYYQQHGTCKYGMSCKNVHELAHETGSYYLKDVNGITVKIPKLYSDRQGIPFANLLLQQEHTELENDHILQFLLQLDKHGFIDHDAMKTNNN